ncbi:hypothetical protein LINGRAPRIM_LOCUS2989 [Linum grandiflorum]
MKAYRTKNLAIHMLHGDDHKQFERLFDYKAELERTNPGSTIQVEYDGLTFQAIYVCLDALKRGFKNGCRRVVCVDGCWLKKLKGWQLLSAVGIDGDDSMYPVAWAIVEKECQSTWDWFKELVDKDLEIETSSEWTFMSDRQKVISLISYT